MKILIVGKNGYLANFLGKELVKCNHEVFYLTHAMKKENEASENNVI